MMMSSKASTQKMIDAVNARTRYNSGLHKGRNLSLFLAGWGFWFWYINGPAGFLTGAAYFFAGAFCYLAIKTRAPLLGLTILAGSYTSIVVFFAGVAWQTWLQGTPSKLPLDAYTYASLTAIVLSAIRDYNKGYPYGGSN